MGRSRSHTLAGLHGLSRTKSSDGQQEEKQTPPNALAGVALAMQGTGNIAPEQPPPIADSTHLLIQPPLRMNVHAAP